MLIDSHCHLDKLDLTPYEGNLQHILRAANEAGVGFFLCPGISLKDFPQILQIAQQNKNVAIGVGLHPSENEQHNLSMDEICSLAQNEPKVVAIGETGLDYYYAKNEEAKAQQRHRFILHIRAANKLQKPLIIHARDAMPDILTILQQEKAATVGGVMHCYTGNWEDAGQLMKLNFYIGISGIITFKNAADIREVVQKIPLEKILLETDAPYLAPVPFRGKANEPAYLRYTAAYLANLRNMTLDQIEKITTENFFRLFGTIR